MSTEQTQGSLTKEAIRLAWPAANEILVMTICFCIVAAVFISALTMEFADQTIDFCGSSEDTLA